WYFLRYMDPHNDKAFCDRNVSDYWNQVDLYIGGTEHAVGHLLYSRMWTKALYDLGYIGFDEPYKKLMNQGMIQGSSRFVYRLKMSTLFKEDYDFLKDNDIVVFVSNNIRLDFINGVKDFNFLEFIKQYFPKADLSFFNNKIQAIEFFKEEAYRSHVNVEFVDGYELDEHKFKASKKDGEYNKAVFIKEENGKFITEAEVEKMSKSKFNTVNPDDLVAKYGADTFRMYEMFLGPVEMSKPWDTKGIEGVHRFLKKLWRLFFDEVKGPIWTTTAPSPLERAGGEAATDAELKVLHKTIKKIEDDTERFSFNTGVSTFMIAVNELTDLKCHKKEILEPLLILLTPYAPHIAEELYAELRKVSPPVGGGDLEGAVSILDAPFPTFEPKYVAESSKEYPISINGKMRTTMDISLSASQDEVEKLVLENDVVKKWIEGKEPRKIIYVKNKMVNVVV
ncbi:MAG: class I tRNA ligase family protein, partial [Bacteroidota bacterium]